VQFLKTERGLKGFVSIFEDLSDTGR
jgi:hypothetical protein